jgi:hypothetical protein
MRQEEKMTRRRIRGSGGGAGVAACGGGSSSSSSGGSGSSSAIRIASIFGEKRPILCVTEKETPKKHPHIGTGTPRIGFQIGESQNWFGVHSNLGTNIYY